MLPTSPANAHRVTFPTCALRALFIHGTTRPFGSPGELREALTLIPAPTELVLVEGAGHDLKRAAGLSAEILELGFTHSRMLS